MYSKESSGINTLSCIGGSMRLRPSWRISTTLKSFLVSSVFCHSTLPHFIRPMLELHKMVPKKIFYSPEFNRSIFSRLMTMTKESTQLIGHWVSDRRLSFWLNISPSSFTDRYSSCWWAGKKRLRGFALAFFWSARKSKYVRFQRTIFEMHLWGFLLGPTYSCHEKFWPTSEKCPLFTDSFLISLHIYLASSWLWLPIRVQFWCSPRVQPFGSDDFSSLGKVYSRQATESVICENSSVSLLWSTVRLQLWSGILHQYKI